MAEDTRGHAYAIPVSAASPAFSSCTGSHVAASSRSSPAGESAFGLGPGAGGFRGSPDHGFGRHGHRGCYRASSVTPPAGAGTTVRLLVRGASRPDRSWRAVATAPHPDIASRARRPSEPKCPSTGQTQTEVLVAPALRTAWMLARLPCVRSPSTAAGFRVGSAGGD